MIIVTQYFHFPNNTELGKGTTHECYLLIPNSYDLSKIFPPGEEVEVIDTLSQKKYYLKASLGREFRINQFGQLYRDYDVHMGDEIILTHIDGEERRTYVNVNKHNRIVIKQGKNGGEIFNIERLTSFKKENEYEIPIIYGEQELTLTIKYKEALAKRNDSPELTDYYTVKIGDIIIPNGSYLLSLGEKNELVTFDKTNIISFPFDESIIIKESVVPNTTQETKPYQIIYYGAPGIGKYLPYLTALRTKPFMLLAGISGTGKSHIVREMAKACWKEGDEEYGKNNPKNFCMVQVKPNWHDSSELIGYVSRINGEKYVVGPFLRFLAKAVNDPDTPYFLCLDEMNLAPVEQYFAEYLSVIESRKLNADGSVTTDPVIPYENTEAYGTLIDQLFADEADRKAYKSETNGKRLTIPQNLFVVGTVNMDETTFSFSRKVLDRAMTIEMNEVNLNGGLEEEGSEIGYIGNCIIGNAAEGKDVYAENKELCDEVIAYLEKVNTILEGTPFKIAYRTRNEFLLYAVNRQLLDKDSQLWQTLDEMTSMKILSRIEGDSERTKTSLEELRKLVNDNIVSQIPEPEEGREKAKSITASKIKEMLEKLEKTSYTSYWA